MPVGLQLIWAIISEARLFNRGTPPAAKATDFHLRKPEGV